MQPEHLKEGKRYKIKRNGKIIVATYIESYKTYQTYEDGTRVEPSETWSETWYIFGKIKDYKVNLGMDKFDVEHNVQEL